jgi:5-methylcytosine-specific restriction protein A
MVKMLRSTLKPAPQRIKPAALTVRETKRTSGTTWMNIRARILKRDYGLCQACKRAGQIGLATQVDHIKALADGGTDDDENLQGICEPCHQMKTSAEAKARAGG